MGSGENGSKLRLFYLFALIAASLSTVLINSVGVVSSQAGRPEFERATLDVSAFSNGECFYAALGTDSSDEFGYRYAAVKPGPKTAKTTLQTGSPPQISRLQVRLKGKNKAIADFEVTDPDGDLGRKSGVSILLFDRDIKLIVAARDGSLLLFGDKNIFKTPLDFSGKTVGTFPFTLKGVKPFPSASVWVSGIRDDTGNLSLAPAAAGIAGRSGIGSAPQILKANSAILQNGDVVGLNLDGSDLEADTVGMSFAFLDASGKVVFALGIKGDDGFETFAPFPLDIINSSVRGKTNFNINFSISGISREVQPGVLRSVAVSLLDSNGNRSPVMIVPFS